MSDERQPSRVDFPITGIGASAGGLAAFASFFSAMPANHDPDMAFVLVQHLAPDHKSMLCELVRRYTRMQVFEVEDGMSVQVNCTYIIPPNHDMALLNGTLQLMEPSLPRGHRMPIDFFFRSLAQDQREHAIGVVLSGSGRDGTLGVRAIKAEGGMAMAQNPASTEYDGMPRSAIDTGLIDYVAETAEMPSRLISYVRHAFGKLPRLSESNEFNGRLESALKKIFVLLRAQTGHDFSAYKPSTIHRRIERRMAVHQVEAIDGYVRFLQQSSTEVEALFRDLLIGVTTFFRDLDAYKDLEEQVIPKLFVGKPADAAIRVWSPGCSTGEEAYSIAILLKEHQEALNQHHRVQVFATDIDGHAIATARAGVFPASAVHNISPERRDRFFTLEPDACSYRIRQSVRDMLIFSEQNVIRDPPFSQVDLISCRNLLIYVDGYVQKKILTLFHYALNEDGFLFLGPSETVGELQHLFRPLDRRSKLFQSKGESRSIHRAPLGPLSPPATVSEADRGPGQVGAKKTANGRPPLRELTEHALLQQVAPAAALINGQGDILYLHGRTGLFLEPTPGEAGVSNILKMAREGLRRTLVTSLHQSVMAGGVIRHQNLLVKTNGDFTPMNLTVRPVVNDAGTAIDPALYLVVLEEAPPADPEQTRSMTPRSSESAHPPDAAQVDARIEILNRELRAKEEYLEAANEELQTSNEELRSANEEMQSINEELQSTNEELETSKEELQSLNEELTTVNAELQVNLADLSRANNDMNNLLAGTGIGTIFLNHRLCILRFTPTITQIINLIPSDVGRPVDHVASNLVSYDRIAQDVQQVLDSLVPKTLEVRTRGGAWYTMRILPYRTLENVIEGAVITFVDITATREARDALQTSETKFRTVFENMTSATAVHEVLLDEQDQPMDYIFLEVNPAFERQIGWRATDIRGRRMTEVYPGIDKALLMASYASVVLTGEHRSFELFLEPTRRTYEVTAYRIGHNRLASVFVAAADGRSREGTLVSSEEREDEHHAS